MCWRATGDHKLRGFPPQEQPAADRGAAVQLEAKGVLSVQQLKSPKRFIRRHKRRPQAVVGVAAREVVVGGGGEGVGVGVVVALRRGISEVVSPLNYFCLPPRPRQFWLCE